MCKKVIESLELALDGNSSSVASCESWLTTSGVFLRSLDPGERCRCGATPLWTPLSGLHTLLVRQFSSKSHASYTYYIHNLLFTYLKGLSLILYSEKIETFSTAFIIITYTDTVRKQTENRSPVHNWPQYKEQMAYFKTFWC